MARQQEILPHVFPAVFAEMPRVIGILEQLPYREGGAVNAVA